MKLSERLPCCYEDLCNDCLNDLQELENYKSQVIQEIKEMQEVSNDLLQSSKWWEGYDTALWELLERLEK